MGLSYKWPMHSSLKINDQVRSWHSFAWNHLGQHFSTLNMYRNRLEHLLKHRLLGPSPEIFVWDGAWEFVFLTIPQMMLVLLVEGVSFKNQWPMASPLTLSKSQNPSDGLNTRMFWLTATSLTYNPPTYSSPSSHTDILAAAGMGRHSSSLALSLCLEGSPRYVSRCTSSTSCMLSVNYNPNPSCLILLKFPLSPHPHTTRLIF